MTAIEEKALRELSQKAATDCELFVCRHGHIDAVTLIALLDTIAELRRAVEENTNWYDKYQRDVEGLNNEGDPIGGDPPRGLRHIAAEARELRVELAAIRALEPVAWVRFRSDGGIEGPILDSRMEEVRKRSGVWTPLYALPQPAPTEEG